MSAARSPPASCRRSRTARSRRSIGKQEEVGLQLATDGEFRRSWWQFDFYKGLDGVELYSTGQGIAFAGVATKAESVRVVGKVGFSGHPHLEHFRFVKDHARVTPKMTIPAPSTLHFRQGRQSISREVYPDLDGYFHDVGAGLPQGHPRLLRRRLPLSAARRHRLVDDLRPEGARGLARRAATIPTACRRSYARMTNQALAGRPPDMVVTMHSCRGNFRSTFIAQGGYEPVAERLLGELEIDGYFLEYDSARAGGFEPLRFVPKGKSRSCSGWSPPRAGRWKTRTTSSGGSRRRPNMSHSISCA